MVVLVWVLQLHCLPHLLYGWRILSKKTLTIQGENEWILLAQMFGELHDELWFGDGLFCTSDLGTYLFMRWRISFQNFRWWSKPRWFSRGLVYQDLQTAHPGQLFFASHQRDSILHGWRKTMKNLMFCCFKCIGWKRIPLKKKRFRNSQLMLAGAQKVHDFMCGNITEKDNKSSRSHWEKQNNWERRVGHSPWVLFGHWRILKHESLEVIFKYSMDYQD